MPLTQGLVALPFVVLACTQHIKSDREQPSAGSQICTLRLLRMVFETLVTVMSAKLNCVQFFLVLGGLV